MTPPDRRVEQTRSTVLEATAALIVEHGCEQVTIDAVAERAGVARSTVYRNWEDRSELFVDALGHLVVMPDFPDTGSLAGDLALVAEHLASALGNGPLGQILPSLASLANREDKVRERLTQLCSSREAVTREVFVRGLVRGEIEPDDLEGRIERFITPFFARRVLTHRPLDEEFRARQVAAACR